MFGGSFARTWMLHSNRLPLFSRMGGFNETEEQKWEHRIRCSYQNMALCLLAERQAALQEDRTREPVPDEGERMACCKVIAGCRRESNRSQPHNQPSTERQYLSRTVQAGKDAKKTRHKSRV